MNTNAEMKAAVKSDLTINDTSSFYPPATIQLALNRAKIKAEGLFKWPEKEDAEMFSAEANKEYYQFPQKWQVDSAWHLEVDSVAYGDSDGSPLHFKDYMFERDNNFPGGNEKIWSVYGRKIFIAPKPTANGDNNVCIWGYIALEDMDEDEDTTIFSYSRPECNDAIVQEAVAILKRKNNNDNSAEFASTDAKATLTNAWNKIKQEQQKYEKSLPFFNVPDFFKSRRSKSRIGNFD